MELSVRLTVARFAFVCATALLFAHAFPPNSARADDSIFYRETFGFCTDSTGTPAGQQARWQALVTGRAYGRVGFLKVFNYGSLDVGNDVNSNPTGFSQGFSFWSKPVYGLSVFTAEFPFDISLVDSVRYEQRLSGVDLSGKPNSSKLAFLIGNAWYISDQGVEQVNGGLGWEFVNRSPHALTYGVVPDTASEDGLMTGPMIPVSGGNPLPSVGRVRAFGIFVDEVNGRVRMDNFELRGDTTGTGISLAAQAPSAVDCPAESPDAAGLETPTPRPTDYIGPSDKDGNSGPDQQIPAGTPPPGIRKTPTPTATPSIDSSGDTTVFCPGTEPGTGPKLRLSAAAKKAILKLKKNPQAIDVRDVTLLTLLVSRALPLGSAVNVTVGDFDRTLGTLTVVPKRGAVAKSVRLSRKVRTLLESYIDTIRAGAAPSAPLFVSTTTGTTTLDVKRAICLRQVSRLVRQRARQAKVLPGVTLLKQTAPRK